MKHGHAFFFPVCLLLCAMGVSAAIVRGPYLQRVAQDEITVCWRSSVAHTGTVIFGESVSNLSSQATESAAATNHAVRLQGLLPGTVYHYQILDGTNVLAGGENQWFRTAPATADDGPRRFWIVGDSGTANANAQAVYDAYRAFNGSQYTDLMLMLGDNAYNNGTDAEYQRAVFNLYAETLRQTPLFSCYGNHDGYSADSATETGPYYDIFVLPRAGECGGVASGTEAYYSFDYGDMHLVCLDSFETARGTNGIMHAWLAQDLAANTSKWLVAFWHHPPYTKGSHDSDTEGALVDMRKNFLPLLESAGVDLVLGGHSHGYERSYLLHNHYGLSSSFDLSTHAVDPGDGNENGDGAYIKTSADGAVYVVAGSSGMATYTQPGYPHPAMQASFLELGSLVLDVAGDRLDARFLRSNGTVRDQLTILKPSVPDLSAISPTNGGLVVRWFSAPDDTYAVKRSGNLLSDGWHLATNNIPATPPLNTLFLDMPTNAAAFFRVEVEQP